MKIIYNGYVYEAKFRMSELDPFEQEKVYEIFKGSYEEATGTAWTKDKFYDRARAWVFYGDVNKGFISTRPQRSGAIKMTGMAGSPIASYRGAKELIDTENKPIWGMATKNIVDKVKALGFISPPAFIVKILFKMIPAEVFGGVPTEVQSDGGIKFSYNDVGDSTKYFFANKDYYKWLFTQNMPEIPAIFRIAFEAFKKLVLS